MRRPFRVFVGVVLLPGLVLGVLALRSIRHHEALLERERGRLNEAAAERLSRAVATRVDELQRDFSLRVESLLGKESPERLATVFDERLRSGWPLARVGFAVSLQGIPLSPRILDGPGARHFLVRNENFLCRQGSVEVFAVTPKGRINLSELESEAAAFGDVGAGSTNGPARFRQIIGDAQEGVLSRFLDDELVVWVWYRTPREPTLVFGAELSSEPFRAELARLVPSVPSVPPGVSVALLDERGRPVSVHPEAGSIDWSRAAATSLVGPALPHWRAVAAVVNPGASRTEGRRLWLGLASVVLLLVGAIAVGGWLVVNDARRQLELARRKSDFVGNVSHELRTPLTSIRLFAEMLAEGRIVDPEKRRRQLEVIRTEAGRLDRLIGNVLDFARSERGRVRYRRESVDLADVTRRVMESFLPQFATAELRVRDEIPDRPIPVAGDADALAQVVNNLLSNVVKYAADGGELTVRTEERAGRVVLEVLDRGPGVPAGCEEKIFEEFFRGDDSLTGGISGAGLGLTLARRIARAHDGEVAYGPRDGGGSCFRLSLPVPSSTDGRADVTGPEGHGTTVREVPPVGGEAGPGSSFARP